MRAGADHHRATVVRPVVGVNREVVHAHRGPSSAPARCRAGHQVAVVEDLAFAARGSRRQGPRRSPRASRRGTLPESSPEPMPRRLPPPARRQRPQPASRGRRPVLHARASSRAPRSPARPPPSSCARGSLELPGQFLDLGQRRAGLELGLQAPHADVDRLALYRPRSRYRSRPCRWRAPQLASRVACACGSSVIEQAQVSRPRAYIDAAPPARRWRGRRRPRRASASHQHVLGLALARAAAGLLQRDHHLEHHVPRLAFVGTVVGHARRRSRASGPGRCVRVRRGRGRCRWPRPALRGWRSPPPRKAHPPPGVRAADRDRPGPPAARRARAEQTVEARRQTPGGAARCRPMARRCAVISRCMRSTACCGSRAELVAGRPSASRPCSRGEAHRGRGRARRSAAW